MPGAITLTNASNDLVGAVSLSNSGSNNVSLTDSVALALGTSTIGQNLTATAYKYFTKRAQSLRPVNNRVAQHLLLQLRIRISY